MRAADGGTGLANSSLLGICPHQCLNVTQAGWALAGGAARGGG